MKQTAVEWLFKNIWTNPPENLLEILDKAKEMEKQQQGYSEEDMKHAFLSGCQSERQIKQRVKCCEEFIEKFKKK